MNTCVECLRAPCYRVHGILQGRGHTNISRARHRRPNACHDGDEHVLLLIEPTRVEAVPDTKEREAHIRQEFLGGLANRKRQKLDDSCAKRYARLTDHE